MLHATLSSKKPQHAVSVTALSPSAYTKWAEKQSEAVLNWFKVNKFEGKTGNIAMIPGHDGNLSRVVLITSDEVSLWDSAALPARLPEGSYVLEGIKKPQDEEKLALGWMLGSYGFNLHKKSEMNSTTLHISKEVDARKVARLAEVIAETRDLITTPAEELGPDEIQALVKEVAKTSGAQLSAVIGDDLLKKNYPAIHAVGRASHRKPRLLDLTWGNPKHPKLTLVGKGVCFDTGGLDLKSASGMFLMRKDMAGAAVALGVARLVMERKLPVRLRLLLPLVDNSINEKAYRPSDVVKMRNGLTVEVGNTDAEGRMILADALAEGGSEAPDLMIDFATLGAARGIFGPEYATLFTNNDGLAKDLMKISEESEDYIWRMPLHKPYVALLKSSFADVVSSPGLPFGAAMITASFLQKFVGETKDIAHLDFMAWNTASKPGRPEGGEAMTLRSVIVFLEKKFGKRKG